MIAGRPIEGPPRLVAVAELARIVTEEPWTLSRADRDRCHAMGLEDESILHAIVLAAYFGHLNRIADAVAVPLDYEVKHLPPHADPDRPLLATAPRLLSGRAAIEIATRPASAAALTAWRSYVFDRDAPLSRRQRTVITRWVAQWLGDGSISSPADLTFNPVDDAMRALAELVTLAPWRITEHSFATLRSLGYDDAQLFDACAVASSAGMFSRIEVALVALRRTRSEAIPTIGP